MLGSAREVSSNLDKSKKPKAAVKWSGARPLYFFKIIVCDTISCKHTSSVSLGSERAVRSSCAFFRSLSVQAWNIGDNISDAGVAVASKSIVLRRNLVQIMRVRARREWQNCSSNDSLSLQEKRSTCGRSCGFSSNLEFITRPVRFVPYIYFCRPAGSLAVTQLHKTKTKKKTNRFCVFSFSLKHCPISHKFHAMPPRKRKSIEEPSTPDEAAAVETLPPLPEMELDSGVEPLFFTWTRAHREQYWMMCEVTADHPGLENGAFFWEITVDHLWQKYQYASTDLGVVSENGEVFCVNGNSGETVHRGKDIRSIGGPEVATFRKTPLHAKDRVGFLLDASSQNRSLTVFRNGERHETLFETGSLEIYNGPDIDHGFFGMKSPKCSKLPPQGRLWPFVHVSQLGDTHNDEESQKTRFVAGVDSMYLRVRPLETYGDSANCMTKSAAKLS